MKLNFKSKLFFLTFIPVLIVIALSIDRITHEFSILAETKQQIIQANIVSKIVYFMQIERGLSAGFAINNAVHSLLPEKI